jgi:hypothetical protein
MPKKDWRIYVKPAKRWGIILRSEIVKMHDRASLRKYFVKK